MATFITSKLTGETINIYVETSTGYWKYNHNGTDFGPFNQTAGDQSIEVLNANGEFTIISCLSDGTVSGDITSLTVSNAQLTSFDGSGLTSLSVLDLTYNQLTEFDGTPSTQLTQLNLGNNQLTEFDGTGLSGLTSLDLQSNQLTSFDGTPLTSLTYLDLNINQLTSFSGTGLTSLTELNLNSNQLTSFDGTGLTQLTYLDLNSNQLTEFDGSGLTSLSVLYLNSNQLTTLGISNMDYLQNLYVSNNLLTPSVNNSLLTKLAANELSNDWDSGEFYTTGGRTSAGTNDYDYLIANGWTISGADLVSNPVWYRFKAPSTEPWDGTIGVDSNQLINQVYLYQSGGFTYYDFLTSETIGEVKFNVQGTETEIVATQVQVTLQEFSSSGSFTAGGGFGGVAIGYSNSPLGNWGTLNSGTLPALPSRYEGQIPAGSVIFTDFDNTISGDPFALITAPILISLTLNDDVIDLTGMYGGPEGTLFDIYKNPPRTPFGFQDGETYTFSMTWGELVETPISRKLRVKGVGQLNP
jgi:Leucine-rich repeat (LRR) protein